MTTIYGIRPLKLDEEMLSSCFGVWLKQLNFFKIRLENLGKNLIPSKRIEARLLLWQQQAMIIFYLFLFFKKKQFN